MHLESNYILSALALRETCLSNHYNFVSEDYANETIIQKLFFALYSMLFGKELVDCVPCV